MSGDVRHNRRKYCAICQKQFYTVLHKFPKDNNLREKWTKLTGINPQGAYINTRICNIHFDDFAWRRQITGGRLLKTLKDDAVPTLFVGENAPPANDECSIPYSSYHNSSRPTVHCAVCNETCQRADSLPIFDKNDYYTEFGVALAIILNITSRVVTSRHSCPKCSSKVIKCYQAVVDINISTMITTRARLKKTKCEGSEQNDENDDEDDDLALTEVAGRLKQSKERAVEIEKIVKSETMTEKCQKCDKKFHNLDKFTEHFLVHLYDENKEVFRRSIAMTQVDEVELEMAADDGVMDDLLKEKESEMTFEKREKKEKRKEKECEEEDGSSMKQDKIKNVEDKCQRDTDEDEEIVKLEDAELQIGQTEGLNGLDDDDPKDDPSSPEADDEDYLPDDDDDDFEEEALPGEGSSKENRAKERKRPRQCRRVSEGSDRPKVKKPWKEPNIPGPRVCYLCGMKLKSHRTYLTHMERHKNPEKFNKTCHLCGKRRVNIAQHVRLCRKDKSRESRERNYPARKLPCVSCKVCGKKVCEMYLRRHLKGHEIDDDIARNGSAALDKYLRTCTLCGRRVKHIGSHMIQHQKKGDIPKTEIQSNFDCAHCGANFNQRTLLVNHMVLKHGADPKRRLVRGVRTKWTCSVCKMEFLSYNLIRKHTLAEHNGVGCDLQCEVCGKKYNARTSYIFHINSQHLDYFKHRCKQCGQYFVEEVSFKEHCLFRCPAIRGRRKRNPTKEGLSSRPKLKREELEVMRTEDRGPEQHIPSYNNLYSSYEAVYSMNHLGNRYLQF